MCKYSDDTWLPNRRFYEAYEKFHSLLKLSEYAANEIERDSNFFIRNITATEVYQRSRASMVAIG
jgi:hypothetical protein